MPAIANFAPGDTVLVKAVVLAVVDGKVTSVAVPKTKPGTANHKFGSSTTSILDLSDPQSTTSILDFTSPQQSTTSILD